MMPPVASNGLQLKPGEHVITPGERVAEGAVVHYADAALQKRYGYGTVQCTTTGRWLNVISWKTGKAHRVARDTAELIMDERSVDIPPSKEQRIADARVDKARRLILQLQYDADHIRERALRALGATGHNVPELDQHTLAVALANFVNEMTPEQWDELIDKTPEVRNASPETCALVRMYFEGKAS